MGETLLEMDIIPEQHECREQGLLPARSPSARTGKGSRKSRNVSGAFVIYAMQRGLRWYRDRRETSLSDMFVEGCVQM